MKADRKLDDKLFSHRRRDETNQFDLLAPSVVVVNTLIFGIEDGQGLSYRPVISDLSLIETLCSPA